MFTGLVEEVGRLVRAVKKGESMELTIEADRVLEGTKIGDSIAVSGVCLTVTSMGGGVFTADVTPQTYRHTTLGSLKPGSPVNLERAMPADGRFGGHIVQGHADGTGVIVSREDEGNAVWFGFRPDDPGLMRYIVPRGSVAVDGISLTVARVDGGSFNVSIIPHTLAMTALRYKRPGDRVNLECDILGKYVEHLLGFARKPGERPEGGGSGLTEALLRENGFI
ncbi:MAG: riboflavin synthase [Thermobacillus sp.]|uniref:Riboflavin synthase n=1 Tax=Thermobacillus composti (strain DSM 18247 / JCM 13945 / KWC4) TaxID=717605 RepID=L0ECM6_THECK|nr:MULTISPECIES: riboflavin synthase [Thermobacillus]AGA58033.1 riboflavin synthase, alpha subunit [Thermobacillus composti KWC4]REK59152.1 MAG: riboflavin synthase [Thermobacillus sp.]